MACVILLWVGTGSSWGGNLERVYVYDDPNASPRAITHPAEVRRLREGLAELDRKGISDDLNELTEMALRAFPGLTKDDFDFDYVIADLARVDLDGEDPIDYLVEQTWKGTAGQRSLMVAIRNRRGIVYQQFDSWLRGLFNWQSGPDRERAFLRQLCIGRVVALDVCDLDGDGRMDLVTYGVLNYPWKEDSSLADLIYFPTPFFWDGERLSSQGQKAADYYHRLFKVISGTREEEGIRKERARREADLATHQ